jgi:hypothetical protein
VPVPCQGSTYSTHAVHGHGSPAPTRHAGTARPAPGARAFHARLPRGCRPCRVVGRIGIACMHACMTVLAGNGEGRRAAPRRRPTPASSSHHRRWGRAARARAGNYWAIECGRAPDRGPSLPRGPLFGRFRCRAHGSVLTWLQLTPSTYYVCEYVLYSYVYVAPQISPFHTGSIIHNISSIFFVARKNGLYTHAIQLGLRWYGECVNTAARVTVLCSCPTVYSRGVPAGAEARQRLRRHWTVASRLTIDTFTC